MLMTGILKHLKIISDTPHARSHFRCLWSCQSPSAADDHDHMISSRRRRPNQSVINPPWSVLLPRLSTPLQIETPRRERGVIKEKPAAAAAVSTNNKTVWNHKRSCWRRKAAAGGKMKQTEPPGDRRGVQSGSVSSLTKVFKEKIKPERTESERSLNINESKSPSATNKQTNKNNKYKQINKQKQMVARGQIKSPAAADQQLHKSKNRP